MGALPWLVAPIGASAVLVFGVPASPLAQPWPVVGGNALSALVGVACAALVPDPALAGALAVALAIALMVRLRCLHPPGGAAALFVVMAHGASPQFAFFPVMTNFPTAGGGGHGVACGHVHQGIGEQLRALVRRVGAVRSTKPEVVGQIMTRQVRVVSEQRPALELVPLFTEDGHHHIPVIDGERRLVGIITQSDLVRALHRAVR
ncbi:HPP family protein [Paracidovorax cattleyae]|uniref:HPP family protein n=1 Tax=Paracidovorax cattleyae TaxID=80868 RepID=UPI001CEF6851|nr:HPP family protein [Paracidovorax cattleyae]